MTTTETGINVAYVGADPVLNENLSTYCTAPYNFKDFNTYHFQGFKT
jgi:hypothetical protein